MTAAAIPQTIIGLALKFTPAGRAVQFTAQAVTSAAALGLPLILGKQLEETDDPNAAVTLLGSSVFGTVEAALGLPSRVITGAVKKKIGEQAYNNWARSFVTGGFKGGLLEATAETIQDATIETAGAAERVDDISELPQELSKTFSDPAVLKI